MLLGQRALKRPPWLKCPFYPLGEVDAWVHALGSIGHHHDAVPGARAAAVAGPRTRDRPQQPDQDPGPVEHRADHLRGVPPLVLGPDLRQDAAGGLLAFRIWGRHTVKKYFSIERRKPRLAIILLNIFILFFSVIKKLFFVKLQKWSKHLKNFFSLRC